MALIIINRISGYTLLAGLLFATSAQAVDFRQLDKQAHAATGCAIASMFRGFAIDADYGHPALIGLSSAIGIGILHEVYKSNSDPISERKQDALATAMGAVACIGISEGVSLLVHRNSVEVNAAFK